MKAISNSAVCINIRYCSHAADNVSFAGCTRKADETWQEALTTWLGGRILCKEAKKHTGNYMAVHRVRPSDDDENSACSDDMVSDEELAVTHASIEAALVTRVGGRGREEDDEGKAGSHKDNSSTGMSLAQTVWTPNNSVNSDISRAEERRVHGLGLSEPEMNAVLGEAKKSQKRGKPLSATVKDAMERGGSLR